MKQENKITNRQKAFINEYLTCLNASKAALLAGYKKRQSGAENLSNPVIKAEIDRRIAENTMGADEVLARLSGQARGDLSQFLRLNASEIQEHPDAWLLKKYKRKVTTGKDDYREETIEIEIHDAQAALVQLGRYHKLFVERQEHSGEIEVKDAREKLISKIESMVGKNDSNAEVSEV